MRRPGATIALAGCLLAAQSASAQIVTAVHACRTDDAGTVVLFGSTSLPQGTAITINAFAREATVIIVGKGTFAAASFGDSGEPSPRASVDVRVTASFTASFTAASQTKDVLRRTGAGAGRLARSDAQLVADDAAVPGGARHLEVTFPVAIVPFTPRTRPSAISKLYILPLPVPDTDKGYSLRATFVVDSLGNGTLVDWTQPNSPEWGKKVLASLLGYRFRPAARPDGTPVCALNIVRARTYSFQ